MYWTLESDNKDNPIFVFFMDDDKEITNMRFFHPNNNASDVREVQRNIWTISLWHHRAIQRLIENSIGRV